MMQIEFRVFDKNIPRNGTDEEIENPSGALVSRWDYIINSDYLKGGLEGKYPAMLYSGCVDKKNNKIYAEDIVYLKNNIGEYKGVVVYKVSPYGSGFDIHWIGNGCGVMWDKLTVIGNTFENPELIKV